MGDKGFSEHPRRAGRLERPTYVPASLPTPSFRWSVGRPKTSFAAPSRSLASALRPLSLSALRALSLGSTEWLTLAVWQDLDARQRRKAWEVLRWAWLKHLGGLHPARRCAIPELETTAGQTHAASPVWLALHLLLSDRHGGREEAIEVQALVRHVLADCEPYETWHQAVLKRLRDVPTERLAVRGDDGSLYYKCRGGTVYVDRVGQIDDRFPPLSPGEYWISVCVPRDALDSTLDLKLAGYAEGRRRMLRKLLGRWPIDWSRA